MEICVNGQKEFVERASAVTDVLAARDNDLKRVIVERNGSLVPREEFASTLLEEGDVLEIVHFVGGG